MLLPALLLGFKNSWEISKDILVKNGKIIYIERNYNIFTLQYYVKHVAIKKFLYKWSIIEKNAHKVLNKFKSWLQIVFRSILVKKK